MAERSIKIAEDKVLTNDFIAMVSGPVKDLMKRIGPRALKYLLIALFISLFVNVLFIIWVPFRNITYTTVQFLWPILIIFLLVRIYYTSINKNVTYISKLFYVAIIPWTSTLLLWSLILPLYYNNDLAYYITGFGFFISYLILIFGLNRYQNSRQLSLVTAPMNTRINIVGLLVSILIAALVLVNIRWDSSRLADMLILLAYLLCDVIILSLCIKLVNMNINVNLNYFIFVIAGFVGINSIADVIFEMRYLFSMNSLLSYKTGQVTDMIYNISLMFVSLALILYNVNIKNKAVDTMSSRLKDSKLLIEDIIMQAPYAICIFDTNGDLVSANDSFLKLFNVKRTDVVRKYNLFSDKNDVGIDLYPGVLKVKQGKKIILPNIEFRQNGNTLYLSVKAFPAYGANNLISNYVTIIEDITDRLKGVQELVSAKTQAELYVDLMGHDINNIHQIALGYLELASNKLDSGGLNKDDSMLILTPMENLFYGSRLIDNVRKLQGERTGLYLKKTVEVDRVLEEVKNQFSYTSDREIIINYDIRSGCKVTANDLLKDVFINILGNAIKHSTGPLVIEVRSEMAGDGKNRYCKIAIEDNGPGIQDNRKLEIFDRMHGVQGMITGKGIGLYLVKTLIDDYNGSVWVEDRVAGDYMKGSRFVVMLPMLNE